MKQKNKVKYSFLYRLLTWFVLLVIIPVFCSWWIYEKVLNVYYIENALSTQQINLENSYTVLETPIELASNTFIAVEGNQEILYHLEYHPDKGNMFYGTYKNVASFCEKLYMMTPYLTDLNIYSDSPLPIYAFPFVKLERFEVEDELFQKIENSGMDIIWHIEESEPGSFPEIYGYKKIYNDNYSACLGYMEIRLSSRLLEDYFEMISKLSHDPQAVLSLYYGDTPLCSTSGEDMERISYDSIKTEKETILSQDLYRHYIKIPELKLCVILSGRLSDVNVMPYNNMPSIFFSWLFVFILILFLLFMMSIVSLSRRIINFTSFIRDSDPQEPSPFVPKGKNKKTDELDFLVDAYNTLIHEKNIMISHVQKMELATKDARYQALQGQIHPHFIYGTLETIRMIALENEDKDAASMIFSLAQLLRYSMSISTKAVTLRTEVEMAKHYLAIQNSRFDNRISCEFRVEEALLEMEMPSFIIQPILENSIAYGISQTLDDCILTVEAKELEDQIILMISNNGFPITEERMEEVNAMLSGTIPKESFKAQGNGVALNNIKERITLFWNGRASIRMALQEGCTTTVIRIEKET